MHEHAFDRTPEGELDGPLDYSALVDELRCHTTEWVRGERDRVVRQQRALRVRELALIRVLDERGAVDDSLAAADGVSVRDVRATVATARALEELPAIASVAAEGRLSSEQLAQVVRVADPSDEHVWAENAPAWSPKDLAQKARERRTPTVEDAAARRAARELRYWWNQESGMLDGRFSLPDIDGATAEKVFDEMIEKLRPATGQPWDTRAHRGADALVELCRAFTERDHDAPTSGARAHFVVQVPTHGPATVAGVPLPHAMVERLRADARIEPVLTADDGQPLVVGRGETVLSEKTKRVVRQRDGHCRYPGCDRRIGLQVHHLWPSSWGGTDEIWNLATVCSFHHAQLAPQGRLLLLGNPNHPAGLSLIDRDDLPALATLAADHARTGSEAG